ncbi:sulfatase [Candidatus Woesearchaeota archaeon]|jgi:arylsulfatase A-like enzyme|nr:sulfatase [Candidatus Woesearchaeota archaeon]MDP6741089.1 sulfatase-like hydrolase/transferase [Planctomycetota bacterium]MDP6939232.1 sulfatase-like hydrolase/transferase [Planctomycetota bacterium]
MWIASFALAVCAGWLPATSAITQDGRDDPDEVITRPRARAVVVLLMDDVSYGDLGCSGSPLGLTPHIDRLSADGVRFSRAYATAATCSPSRAAILTGRYQQRFGHEFNPQHKIGKAQGLSASEITLARRLGWAGFATGIIGKWHLGYGAASHPLSHGFDEFYGFLSGARSYRAYTDGRSQRQNDLNRLYNGKEPVEEQFTYLTTELGERAADFIDRHAEEPFFLFLSFSAVHSPFHEDPEMSVDLPETVDPERAPALRMLASLDRAVGHVLGALERHSRTDDTLVVLMSDNGGRAREEITNWDLLGKKGELLEGGVRVPLILSWPEALPRGVEYSKNVSTLDVVPTALAAVGRTRPKGLDGVDLAPFVLSSLEAADQQVPHPILYWRQGEQWALLEGDHKIVDRGPGPFYRNLADREGGFIVLSRDKPEAALQKKIDELLSAHELWTRGLRNPRWRKYTLDDD